MDLDKDLHLNEITEIVILLGANTEVAQASKSFTYEGVKYDVLKCGNVFGIRTSQGKELTVSINNTLENSGKSVNGLTVIYDTHKVEVDYSFENGEGINLTSNMSLDTGYEGFKSMCRHNLHETDCYTLSFVSADNEKVAELSSTLASVKLAGKTITYTFKGDTISADIQDSKIISADNYRLITLHGKMVPSMKTITSFDGPHDLKRIKNRVKNGNYHTVSKEIIDGLDALYADKQSYFDEVKKYYEEEVKDVMAAKSIRKRAEEGVKTILTENEINICINAIQPVIEEKQKEVKKEKGTALKKDK